MWTVDGIFAHQQTMQTSIFLVQFDWLWHGEKDWISNTIDESVILAKSIDARLLIFCFNELSTLSHCVHNSCSSFYIIIKKWNRFHHRKSNFVPFCTSTLISSHLNTHFCLILFAFRRWDLFILFLMRSSRAHELFHMYENKIKIFFGRFFFVFNRKLINSSKKGMKIKCGKWR